MDNNSKLEFDFANVTAELEKKNIKELRESIFLPYTNARGLLFLTSVISLQAYNFIDFIN